MTDDTYEFKAGFAIPLKIEQAKVTIDGDLDVNDSLNITSDLTVDGITYITSPDISLSTDTTLTGAQMMYLDTVYITGNMVLGLDALADVDDIEKIDFAVVIDGTYTCIVDPNHVDNIRMDGVTESDGEEITSGGTTDEILIIKHYNGSSATLRALQDGGWSPEA